MEVKKIAPVVVFVYNRLDKAKNCIEALEKCLLTDQTELHVFADGAKGEKDKDKVEAVHKWLREYGEGSCSFSKVFLHIKEKNAGLASSIISGVTQLTNDYGKVIVVEDDLIVARSFLQYMNGALDYYEEDDSIWEIASYGYNLKALRKYNHDIYLGYRASSWGWATWKDRWDACDWEVKDYEELKNSKEMQEKFCRGGGDLYPMLQRQMRGESDSWAIRWAYSCAMKDKYVIYPKVGQVSNDGFDGTGIHSGLHAPKSVFADSSSKVIFEKVLLDPKITREFYLMHTDTFLKKVKRNLSVKDIVKLIKRIGNTDGAATF